MSTAWLLDLSVDALNVELTIDDVMADLDPAWVADTAADEVDA